MPPKTEESTATPTAAPATTATYSWTSGAIPIDPALQQQSQQATTSPYPHYQYTSHYPQAAYATHYQAYTPPTATTTQTTARQPSTPVTAYQTSTYALNAASSTTAASTGPAANNGMDTSDISTLNDALGSAGVDLKAEEESLQRSQTDHSSSTSAVYRSYEDRTRKQPPKPNFNTTFLGHTVRTLSANHKVNKVSDDSINYIALALRARLQDLVQGMIKAANHRIDAQFDRPASMYESGGMKDESPGEGEGEIPMWSIVVRSDVAKQLSVLERIEREEEIRIRKERKERAEMTAAHAAALAAQANANSSGTSLDPNNGGGGSEDVLMDSGTSGSSKKKRKKDGPGVTARNMSEDVRKKMSNAVATQAAGLGKYSWMTAGGGGGAVKKASTPALTTTSTTTTTATTTTTMNSTTAATSTATSSTTTATSTSQPTAPASATTPTGANSSANSTWARPYVPTLKKGSNGNGGSGGDNKDDDSKVVITMRDAMFVVSKERGHGGGRGSARGWV